MTNKKITTILWDNDNTLMDFEYSMHKALYACFEAFGLEINEAIISRYEEINADYWKRLERGEITKSQLLNGRFADLFKELGYEIGEVTPVDLFPRTGHVESVVCLTRKENI